MWLMNMMFLSMIKSGELQIVYTIAFYLNQKSWCKENKKAVKSLKVEIYKYEELRDNIFHVI